MSKIKVLPGLMSGAASLLEFQSSILTYLLKLYLMAGMSYMEFWYLAQPSKACLTH